MKNLFVLAGLALALNACTSLVAPSPGSAAGPSSPGVWSSVMGYHGPSNSVAMPGGPN